MLKHPSVVVLGVFNYLMSGFCTKYLFTGMSDKMLVDGVGKVQSLSDSAKDPLLRDALDDQSLWPLEYNSHTTLEHLYNQVSNRIYCWLCYV